jgi:hypothetical protein
MPHGDGQEIPAELSTWHWGIKSFALLDVCADDDGALVRYRAGEFVGPGFANVERFEFRDNQIVHVEVYFGRELG